MKLTLLFLAPQPADLWGQAIVEATQPGRFCHVEAQLPAGYFSSREPFGVAFLRDVPVANWERVETPWTLSDEAEDFANVNVGDSYDWEGAFLSAIGRAQPQPGKAFCSGIVSQIVAMCGGPKLLSLPNPNRLYDAVMCAMGKTQVANPTPVSAEAIGRFYDLAQERTRAAGRKTQGIMGGGLADVVGQLQATLAKIQGDGIPFEANNVTVLAGLPPMTIKGTLRLPGA